MTVSKTDTPDRDRLALQADRARQRLVRTLSALDVRRHQITRDLKHPAEIVAVELRSHARPLIVVGSGLIAAVATGALIKGLRARARAKHPYRERWDAVVRVWEHPERIASRRSVGFGAALGRSILGAFMAAAAGEVVRQVVRTAKTRSGTR